jgi:hypothetical protein
LRAFQGNLAYGSIRSNKATPSLTRFLSYPSTPSSDSLIFHFYQIFCIYGLHNLAGFVSAKIIRRCLRCENIAVNDIVEFPVCDSAVCQTRLYLFDIRSTTLEFLQTCFASILIARWRKWAC